MTHTSHRGQKYVHPPGPHTLETGWAAEATGGLASPQGPLGVRGAAPSHPGSEPAGSWAFPAPTPPPDQWRAARTAPCLRQPRPPSPQHLHSLDCSLSLLWASCMPPESWLAASTGPAAFLQGPRVPGPPSVGHAIPRRSRVSPPPSASSQRRGDLQRAQHRPAPVVLVIVTKRQLERCFPWGASPLPPGLLCGPSTPQPCVPSPKVKPRDLGPPPPSQPGSPPTPEYLESSRLSLLTPPQTSALPAGLAASVAPSTAHPSLSSQGDL